MTLISDSEMEALREVALSGMVTTINVYNRSTVQTDDGQESVFPASPSSVVQGWLYELTPARVKLDPLNGSEQVAEYFRLLLPVGTVIDIGDKVVIGGNSYYVQNTGIDNTYKPTLTAAVRRVA